MDSTARIVIVPVPGHDRIRQAQSLPVNEHPATADSVGLPAPRDALCPLIRAPRVATSNSPGRVEWIDAMIPAGVQIGSLRPEAFVWQTVPLVLRPIQIAPAASCAMAEISSSGTRSAVVLKMVAAETSQ